MTSPELKIYARGPNGLAVLNPIPGAALQLLDNGNPSTAICFSTDGSQYACLSETGVTVHSSETDVILMGIDLPRVLAAAFSPNGTYLTIFQRPTADTKGEKNLSIVHIASGDVLLHLYQKAFSKSTWPSMMWVSDEGHVARLVSNEVHVYDATRFGDGISARLRCQGVSALAVAPGSTEDPKFAIFVPEMKGAPGNVRIHSFSKLVEENPKPLARRSFFKCTEVQFQWNSVGTAVLVFATCDVDKSNQSYYGESNLHFLKADGSHEGNVPLGKEGPIHDMQWSANGAFFVVVYGFMPAKATLFNDSCRPLYEFGTGPWNTVRWSPHSRFLCLCGFGNLPGDMEFFDKKADGKCKKLGEVKQPCVVTCEWSPCSRQVLIATTQPRLRVDNGFKVLTYRGQTKFEHACDVLYEAVWRPAPSNSFQDLPQSPRSEDQANKGGVARPTSAKPTAYRPPHRAAGIPGAAPSLSLARDDDSKGGKYRPPSARGVPGEELAGESKSAKANRKKREAAARKKADGNSKV